MYLHNGNSTLLFTDHPTNNIFQSSIAFQLTKRTVILSSLSILFNSTHYLSRLFSNRICIKQELSEHRLRNSRETGKTRSRFSFICRMKKNPFCYFETYIKPQVAKKEGNLFQVTKRQTAPIVSNANTCKSTLNLSLSNLVTPDASSFSRAASIGRKGASGWEKTVGVC